VIKLIVVIPDVSFLSGFNVTSLYDIVSFLQQ